MDTESMFYPLRTVDPNHLQKLGQVLWNWQLCSHCASKPSCSLPGCPWSRAGRLGSFWDRYKGVTEAYVPDFIAQRPALISHDQLLTLINETKTHPDIPRTNLRKRIFDNSRTSSGEQSTSADQDRAFSIAASILFLMECGTSQVSADSLDNATPPFPWRDCMSANEFMSEAFPRKSHPYFNRKDKPTDSLKVLFDLNAVQLIKNTELRFEATSDLRAHLTLDHKGMVRVFDCTAVLKEILLATASDSEACIIPRPLVLEVLDTIHNVLFPPDRDSQALLSSLVSKRGFDKDLLRYESAQYKRNDDPEITYSYFGARLAELYDESRNPTPRTRLESWFERKSGARYMLMVTMIGVIIAVILGFLGLAVAGFQAWLTYQQWKHPV